jgi:hypothetical protein
MAMAAVVAASGDALARWQTQIGTIRQKTDWIAPA